MTPPDDGRAETRYFEPWTPARGDRVRVRISAECRTQVHYLGAADRDDVDQQGHDPAEDGVTGVVGWVDPPTSYGEPSWDAHRFLVEFDAPVTVACTDHPHMCQYLAAVELEPLEDRP